MLGSYQRDALQNITGKFGVRDIRDAAMNIGIIIQQYGAFHESQSAIGAGNNTAANSANVGTYRETAFDASRVARTSTETRSSNTALAPRIVAF